MGGTTGCGGMASPLRRDICIGALGTGRPTDRPPGRAVVGRPVPPSPYRAYGETSPRAPNDLATQHPALISPAASAWLTGVDTWMP